MPRKPGDFFLGVVELFGILLPGAILAFLLAGPAASMFDGRVLPGLTGDVQRGAAFLVAAYVLGQGLDALGSLVLDPLTNRLYREGRVREHRRLFARARAVRDGELGSHASMEVSAFRWARTQVALRSPDGARAVERLEAEAKFFRSLTLVLAVAAVRFAFAGVLPLAIGLALFAGLSATRTAIERWQRDKTALEFYVASASGGAAAREDSAEAALDVQPPVM